MDERLLILDKILRNKTAVKRLQTSRVLFCKCQLAVINHYAYKDIYEKKTLIKGLKILVSSFLYQLNTLLNLYQGMQ